VSRCFPALSVAPSPQVCILQVYGTADRTGREAICGSFLYCRISNPPLPPAMPENHFHPEPPRSILATWEKMTAAEESVRRAYEQHRKLQRKGR